LIKDAAIERLRILPAVMCAGTCELAHPRAPDPHAIGTLRTHNVRGLSTDFVRSTLVAERRWVAESPQIALQLRGALFAETVPESRLLILAIINIPPANSSHL
jgi:hypothetical protein